MSVAIPLPERSEGLSQEQRRRNEILGTAAALFASGGLRTSLQEIADACGIQAGSLYHHFESKEGIVLELIQRYHRDLDELAARSSAAPVASIADDLARCAARNSAAVQFTFYEPPGGASAELVAAAQQPPTAVEDALLQALRRGEAAGEIRPGLDLPLVTDRVRQTMLHAGLGLFHSFDVARVSAALRGILFDGLAAEPPGAATLDASAPLARVQDVIAGWPDPDLPAGDRAAQIRAVARAEFGRRGYEVTTVRDIASAAGLAVGTVYRAIGSKEELLQSIMAEFTAKTMSGWQAALRGPGSMVEKLDAAAWLQLNVLERFADEFRTQLAWMRQSPPDIPDLNWSFPNLLRQLKSQLSAGVRSGELRLARPSADLTVLCVVDVTWIPENIIRAQGKARAQQLARDTILAGVATR